MTLILGGTGQLGTELRRIIPNAVAPSRTDLDLADTRNLKAQVIALEPTRIINCAAYTAVDAAEDDEEAAVLVNGAAVGELAAAANDLGIPFVTFSSDYVFDGASGEEYPESREPKPRNAYGRSKVIGERLALSFPGSLVIRTSWVLSATHPNFVTKILEKGAAGEVRVVDDQWGRPTLVVGLAEAVMAALDQGLNGLLHLANPPTTTWFGLAREVLRHAGIDPDRVVACSTDQFPGRAPRPAHAVLTSERADLMRDWRIGLADLVRSL